MTRPLDEKIKVARVGNQARIRFAWRPDALLLDLDEAAYLANELLRAVSEGGRQDGGPRPSGRNARARRAQVVGTGGRS